MLLINNSDEFIGAKKSRLKSENEVEKIMFQSDAKELFGEELFVIARHLDFADIDDEIDTLAVDEEGNLVIVEFKKSYYSATEAVSQVCRYASYVSRWSLLEIKKTTEDYYLQKSNNKINFEKKIEEFLKVDLSYINQNQRILFLGTDHNQKFFSSCSWLQSQGVDIQIFSIEKYLSSTKNIISVKKVDLDAWIQKHPPRLKSKYNKKFHLQSCTRDVVELTEAFVDIINEEYDYKGPIWSTQSYVKYIDESSNKNILQFTVNKESIYVNSFSSVRGKFDKKLVKKKLKKRVGFDITGKIKFYI